jgi:hypothetical protein
VPALSRQPLRSEAHDFCKRLNHNYMLRNEHLDTAAGLEQEAAQRVGLVWQSVEVSPTSGSDRALELANPPSVANLDPQAYRSPRQIHATRFAACVTSS